MSDADWVDDISDESAWVDDKQTHEPGFGERIARGAISTLPAIGAIGGAVIGSPVGGPVGSVAGGGLGYAAGSELKDFLSNQLLGDEAVSAKPLDQLKRVATNTAIGSASEMGGQILGKGLSEGSKWVANKSKGLAEDLALNATGATGVQASKFDDDAGRQLLDRNLIKFGDNAENIANRTQNALSKANSDIDHSLTSLDKKGVTVSADKIVSELQSKIASLRKDPSQSGVVRKLEGIIDDIIQTGESSVPISTAEKTKRGFNKISGNWMDPEVGQAGKETYLRYRDAVENAANAADPELATLFKEGKETFGLLKPIEEAAQRRSFQLNQSPFGQLGDMVAAGTGMAGGGPAGGAAMAGAKRLLFPRASSSAAVTLDNVSKALMKSPRMTELYQKNPDAFKNLATKLSGREGMSKLFSEKNIPRAAEKENNEVQKSTPMDKQKIFEKTKGSKYSQALQNADQRGGPALGATHFILSQTDPEYRKLTLGDEDEK